MTSQRSAVSVMPASSSASETAVLRSRIEQQSDLIMMLKKHNDNMKQEKIQLELAKLDAVELAKEAQDRLDVATSEKNTLSSRFQTLADNHAQTVKFMEEHKAEVMRLRNRMKVMDQELESAVATATKEVNVQHNKTLSNLRTRVQELEAADTNATLKMQKTQAELEASNAKARSSASELRELQTRFHRVSAELTSVQTSEQGSCKDLEEQVRSLREKLKASVQEMNRTAKLLEETKLQSTKAEYRVSNLQKENDALCR